MGRRLRGAALSRGGRVEDRPGHDEAAWSSRAPQRAEIVAITQCTVASFVTASGKALFRAVVACCQHFQRLCAWSRDRLAPFRARVRCHFLILGATVLAVRCAT